MPTYTQPFLGSNTSISPALTVAQKQAKLIAQLRARKAPVLRQMAGLHKWAMDLFWNNPDGLSPQQALDALMSDGVRGVSLIQGLANICNMETPGSATTLPPTNVNITFPQDTSGNPTGRVLLAYPGNDAPPDATDPVSPPPPS